MICIDGPAGAGKTTLSADLLSAARASGASAHVVHLDDTYDGWQQDLRALGGRLRNYLVGPLASGHAGRYRRFDWHSYTFQEWITVSRTDLLILEGVGSSHWNLASRRAALVWVDAPADVCLSRGITRDGEEMRAQWLSWKQRESDFFRSFEPQQGADIEVLTTNAR
jgi:uridine kinase